MKATKRLISYFLIASLILTGIIPYASAKAVYEYSETAKTLRELGIYEEIGTDMDKLLTRAEFAGLVAPISGEIIIGSNSDIYADVNDKNPYYDEIYTLAKRGIMNGYPEGTFCPDATITLNESLAVLTKILGYGVVVEYWGDWYAGYRRAADQANLLYGINVDDANNLTYGEALQLIYNTLNAEILQETAIHNNNSIQVGTVDGETVLSERFGIKSFKGILTANALTSLTGGGVGKGRVKIGTIVFKCDENKLFTELLGYNVTAYYNEAEEKVLSIIKNNKKNDELYIMAQYVEPGQQLENLVIKYQAENGSKKQKKLDTGYDVIYNGMAYPDITNAELNIKSGYIWCVDNDNDGDIDVLNITEFTTVVVSGVNADSSIVFGVDSVMYPGDIRSYVDLSSSDDYISINDTEGNIVSLSDIGEDSVLSVAKSKGNATDVEIYNCILENRGMIGTITAISTDDYGRTVCVINDNIYELTPELRTEISGGGLQAQNFSVGKTKRFALTFDGKIAYSFNTGDGINYGYLMNAMWDEGEQIATFWIVTDKGVKTGFKATQKIRFNAARNNITARLKAEDVITSLGGNRNIPQELVTYELNDAGELKTLYLAENATGFDASTDLDDKLFYYATPERHIWRTNSKTIDDYVTSTDTVFFYIRERDALTNKVVDGGISINVASFVDGETLAGSKVYDFGYTKTPKAVVVEYLDNTVASSEEPIVIQSIVTRWDTVLGETVTKLTGWQVGVLRDFEVDENLDVSMLDEGDIIYPVVSVKGELIGFDNKWVDISAFTATAADLDIGGSGYGNSLKFTSFGKVKAYENNAVGVYNGTRLRGHSITTSAKIYKYNPEGERGKKVTLETVNSLYTHANVVIASRRYVTKLVMVVQ